MSRPNRTTSWKTLVPFGLLALLLAVVRRRPDDWEYGEAEPERPAAPEPAACRDSSPSAGGAGPGARPGLRPGRARRPAPRPRSSRPARRA